MWIYLILTIVFVWSLSVLPFFWHGSSSLTGGMWAQENEALDQSPAGHQGNVENVQGGSGAFQLPGA